MSLSWKSRTIAPPADSPFKSESISLHVTPFFPLALPFSAITFMAPPFRRNTYFSLCPLYRITTHSGFQPKVFRRLASYGFVVNLYAH